MKDQDNATRQIQVTNREDLQKIINLAVQEAMQSRAPEIAAMREKTEFMQQENFHMFEDLSQLAKRIEDLSTNIEIVRESQLQITERVDGLNERNMALEHGINEAFESSVRLSSFGEQLSEFIGMDEGHNNNPLPVKLHNDGLQQE